MATTRPTAGRPHGPDRLTVGLLTLAAFLAVLALMAWQFRPAPARRTAAAVVLRRVYETRVITTVVGPSNVTGTSQSVSSTSSALPVTGAAVTRSS